MKPDSLAPVHMVADPTWQLAFGILHFSVAAAVILYAACTPLLQRNWHELLFRMMVLLGGSLGAFVFEGAIDRSGQLWYAEIGAWRFSHIYGVYVPLWVLPVYTWFLGGGALVLIQAVRAGRKPSFYFMVFAGIVIADMLLEWPIILFGKLYAYWGETQPFFHPRYFPVPLWFLIVNRFFDFFPAILVLAVMSTRKRWAVLTVPFVMMSGAYGAYAITTWPVVGALQNGYSSLWTHLAAALTMLLAVLGTYVCVAVAPRLRYAMDDAPKDQTGSSASATPAARSGGNAKLLTA